MAVGSTYICWPLWGLWRYLYWHLWPLSLGLILPGSSFGSGILHCNIQHITLYCVPVQQTNSPIWCVVFGILSQGHEHWGHAILLYNQKIIIGVKETKPTSDNGIGWHRDLAHAMYTAVLIQAMFVLVYVMNHPLHIGHTCLLTPLCYSDKDYKDLQGFLFLRFFTKFTKQQIIPLHYIDMNTF